MRLAHSPEQLETLRRPTASAPLRLVVSGCLGGRPCGVDGTDYGLGDAIASLLALPTVQANYFCPEAHSLGTPRTTPDIHGGDGFAVLDGTARVLDEHGTDITEEMIAGARAMVATALGVNAELAILTDMSAACGSQVVSDGCRFVRGKGAPALAVEQRSFRAGVGVATAALLRAGIRVVSQRDHKTLGQLRAILEPAFVPDPNAIDHHATPWYRGYFGAASVDEQESNGSRPPAPSGSLPSVK